MMCKRHSRFGGLLAACIGLAVVPSAATARPDSVQAETPAGLQESTLRGRTEPRALKEFATVRSIAESKVLQRDVRHLATEHAQLLDKLDALRARVARNGHSYATRRTARILQQQLSRQQEHANELQEKEDERTTSMFEEAEKEKKAEQRKSKRASQKALRLIKQSQQRAGQVLQQLVL